MLLLGRQLLRIKLLGIELKVRLVELLKNLILLRLVFELILVEFQMRLQQLMPSFVFLVKFCQVEARTSNVFWRR